MIFMGIFLTLLTWWETAWKYNWQGYELKKLPILLSLLPYTWFFQLEPHRIGAILWTGIVTTVLAIYFEGIALQVASATEAALLFSSEVRPLLLYVAERSVNYFLLTRTVSCRSMLLNYCWLYSRYGRQYLVRGFFMNVSKSLVVAFLFFQLINY